MRLKLFFDGKPSSDIRDALKSNGFRWAPGSGCWQRILTGNAIFDTKSLLKEIGATLQPQQDDQDVDDQDVDDQDVDDPDFKRRQLKLPF